MSDIGSSFRERLLASESWDSPARLAYDEAVRRLVTRKLTRAQRVSFAAIAVALVCLAPLHIYLAANVAKLPSIARIALLEGAALQVLVAGYLVYVLWSGVFHRRRTPTFLSGIMWGVGLLLAIHFVALIPAVNNVNVGLFFLGITILSLIGPGLQLIRTCVEQSELNMHERLLELTYRLLEARGDANTDSSSSSD